MLCELLKSVNGIFNSFLSSYVYRCQFISWWAHHTECDDVIGSTVSMVITLKRQVVGIEMIIVIWGFYINRRRMFLGYFCSSKYNSKQPRQDSSYLITFTAHECPTTHNMAAATHQRHWRHCHPTQPTYLALYLNSIVQHVIHVHLLLRDCRDHASALFFCLLESSRVDYRKCFSRESIRVNSKQQSALFLSSPAACCTCCLELTLIIARSKHFW